MGLTLSGQENSPLAKPIDLWPEPGTVTEMRVIQDIRGGTYIFYIMDGEFRVLRKRPGENLSPYSPIGFDGSLISARNLVVIAGGPEQYSAFIGEKEGFEEIYLFELNYRGDLIYHPLKETRAVFIPDYSVYPSFDGSVRVYTLSENHLRCIAVGGREGNPNTLYEISYPGEAADSFELSRDRNQQINYGWYRVPGDNHWEITLFSLDEKGLLIREKTGIYTELPVISFQGRSGLTILNGREVSSYRIDRGSISQYLRLIAPLKVRQYWNAFRTGYVSGLMIGETDGEEVVYGVEQETSVLPVFRRLFSFPQDSLIDIFFIGNNQISLMYRYGRDWYSAFIDLREGLKKEGRLQLSGELLRMISSDKGIHPRFYALCLMPDGSGGIVLFQFDRSEWNSSRIMHIPDNIPMHDLYPGDGVFLNPFYTSRGTLFMAAPNIAFLFDTESSGYQIIENQKYSWSPKLNGVMYFAISSGNIITLYCIEG
jgi:hypothetical protein